MYRPHFRSSGAHRKCARIEPWRCRAFPRQALQALWCIFHASPPTVNQVIHRYSSKKQTFETMLSFFSQTSKSSLEVRLYGTRGKEERGRCRTDGEVPTPLSPPPGAAHEPHRLRRHRVSSDTIDDKLTWRILALFTNCPDSSAKPLFLSNESKDNMCLLIASSAPARRHF